MVAFSALWFFCFFQVVMLNLGSAVAFCLLAYTLTMQKWMLHAKVRGSIIEVGRLEVL